ncbi:PKD domain-containing protein [Haladaptatus litoreus]|uniref:PKD domain-containing protein n=1 Tax=Haladaptatus litoreus TaxID=553468 RepID=A0A1N6V0L5_9EURY|nr:PKD domain-containing protein [Haladaptatus litoreus]SIQ71423.1 PKD domain-containing protein [Haladaptatus litoreus]
MSNRTALTALLLVTLVVSTFGIATALPPPGLPGDTLPDTPASEHDTYSVQQGDTCVAVNPIQGDENVVSFYDYRNPYTEPSDWSYSSFAPGNVTRENGSTMFLYEAPNGVVSLVVLHDQLRKERTGDKLPMSAVSFSFDSLPESGAWILMDDTYDGRDDQWSRNQIDWTWTGSRVDGAVFRGLSGEYGLTVSPSWNEGATLYDSRFESEPVTSWAFLSGSASDPNETQLDMGQSVTIRPGGCGSPPAATLTASDSVETGQQVTFDASESSDPDGDISEYRWDFDGDGEVDETTTKPTATHTYESAGKQTANVTAVDSENATDSATATVQVVDSAHDGENDSSPNKGSSSEGTENQQSEESNALPGSDSPFGTYGLGVVALAAILLVGGAIAKR